MRLTQIFNYDANVAQILTHHIRVEVKLEVLGHAGVFQVVLIHGLQHEIIDSEGEEAAEHEGGRRPQPSLLHELELIGAVQQLAIGYD